MSSEPSAPPSPRKRVHVAALGALALGILGLGYYLSDVLNPLLIALLIAYVLNPLVERLERLGIGRRFAVSVLFALVFVGVTSGLGYAAFEGAVHLEELKLELSGERILDPKDPIDKALIKDAIAIAQLGSATTTSSLIRRTPEGEYFIDENQDGVRQTGLLERISKAISPHLRRISKDQVEGFVRALENQAGQALELGAEASRGLRLFLSGLGNLVGYVLLVPIYTFFLLLSLTALRARVRELLPGRYRERVIDIATKIDHANAAFFRGRVVIAILKGLITWGGLALVGVPFSFFIGMGAGVLSIIPLLGPLVGGALALVFSYEGPGSFGARVLGVVVTFAAAEGADALLYPVIIGRETGLHPLALIVALFAFGKLFGLFGLLLAVPIACAVKILFAEFVLPELRVLAQEEPGAP